jgi:hypothetical protein
MHIPFHCPLIEWLPDKKVGRWREETKIVMARIGLSDRLPEERGLVLSWRRNVMTETACPK